MLADAALFVAGLAVLYFAGDRLVVYASALAERLGLSPAVIGLTIVAAGTSAPELFVSLFAALKGKPEIAAANVLGSNIANVSLILGLTAMIRPIPIAATVARLDYPFLLLSTWVSLLLCRDLLLDRLEAGFLVASVVAFMGYSVAAAKRVVPEAEKEKLEGLVPKAAEPKSQRSPALLIAGIVGAAAVLGVGSDLLVRGASGIAARLGMSDRVIGLTLVAVGTSLPELVASVLAAVRGHHELALANVVGSNIFNLLFILGSCGVVRPVPLAPGLVAVDFWAAMAAAVALVPFVYWLKAVGRNSGAALLFAYAYYALQTVKSG